METGAIGAASTAYSGATSGKTNESNTLAYLTNPLDRDKKPEQHTSAFTAMNSVFQPYA